MLKQVLNVVTSCSKAYGMVKIAERTGMTYPEIIIYKENAKNCSDYYYKKISMYIKEFFNNRKAKIAQQKITAQSVPQVVEQDIKKTIYVA